MAFQVEWKIPPVSPPISDSQVPCWINDPHPVFQSHCGAWAVEEMQILGGYAN